MGPLIVENFEKFEYFVQPFQTELIISKLLIERVTITIKPCSISNYNESLIMKSLNLI